MAELFIDQAKHYAETRPDYPPEMFDFIASKTPERSLVWDVGTGSGQAAKSLAEMYNNVVATDTSQKQIDLAPKLPNICYIHTKPTMSLTETATCVAPKSTVDLVTVAQALHWFDLPNFYTQVKHVLKKPNGVLAAWCYTVPRVDAAFDLVLDRFYTVDSAPYWDSLRRLVDQEYRSVDFPFEAVDDDDGRKTGPFEFVSEKVMDLGGFLVYLKSWSAYQTAKKRGVELLGDRAVEDFRRAWGCDGEGVYCKKVVRFPIFLRIGKVGDCVE